MTGTKRTYIETEREVYDRRRQLIEKYHDNYVKVFNAVNFEKYEYEKNNNRLRGGNGNER